MTESIKPASGTGPPAAADIPNRKLTSTSSDGKTASAWRSAGICLWLGSIAGLCERVCYHFFPGPLGPDDLWWATVADLLFFAMLAAAFFVLATLLPRLNLEGIAFFFGSALLAVDCLSIAIPEPAHALVHSASAALIAFLLTPAFLKLRRAIFRLGTYTVPALALYLLCYLIVLPIFPRREVRPVANNSNASSPNVLLIIVDTLGADHLSTYGYSRLTSPKLSAFAAGGLLFENAVAPSSWTLPSHASMLTGRYPTEHHAGQNDWRLDAHFPTVAEAFSKQGYRTAAFSANPYMFSRRVGLARGYQHFEEGTLLQRLFLTNLGRRIQNRLMLAHVLQDAIGRSSADDMNREAIRWIQKENRPFFITINYFDVHEPFMPSPDYLHRFSRLKRPLNQFYWQPDVQLAPNQVQDEIDAYDASIAFIDDKIANFLAELKKRDVLENTIVVITSDHGETFQQHGFMFHGRGLYWDLIHVPLVIRAPGRVPREVRIVTPVSLQSLPSTLLDLAGIKGQNQFSEASLVALWKVPDAQDSWPYPVSELAHMGASPRFPSYYGPMRSVVTPKWHFIQGGRWGKELYACCAAEADNRAPSSEGERLSAAFAATLEDEDGLRVTPQALSADLKSGTKQVLARTREHTSSQDERKKMNDLIRALGYTP